MFFCQIKSHLECQSTHCLVSLLYQGCITIRNASPTLKQHCFNCLCLNKTDIFIVALKTFQLSIPNTQYWYTSGPLFLTLARHVHQCTSIGSYYRPCKPKRQCLLTLQVSRYCLLHLKSSIVQYLLTLQVSRNCLSYSRK